MGTRIKMGAGSRYIDQTGDVHESGSVFETDAKEAERLITGGSASYVDKQGREEDQ